MHVRVDAGGHIVVDNLHGKREIRGCKQRTKICGSKRVEKGRRELVRVHARRGRLECRDRELRRQ